MHKIAALPLVVAAVSLTVGRSSQAPEASNTANSVSSVSESPAASATPAEKGLIVSSTGVEAHCGVRAEGDSILLSTADLTPADTFGEDWNHQRTGEDCVETKQWIESKAYGSEEDARGNPMLEPEYQAVANKHFGQIENDEYGKERLSQMSGAMDKCLGTADRVLSNGDNIEAVRQYAASLKICPGHPQAGQWGRPQQHMPEARHPEQEQEAVIKEREEAEVNGEIAVDGGHYLIGETLKPGMCRTD
ncbi:hypothetical protein [Kocuria sp. SM24M-10]|uniref:hypothetical protein n=1 Tax=Kocuria sp. SM24M-10 TaxID=1660349 RepID=UPI000A72A182|nr:hypothetical protein [Kocuria sp. SM24M-10]